MRLTALHALALSLPLAAQPPAFTDAVETTRPQEEPTVDSLLRAALESGLETEADAHALAHQLTALGGTAVGELLDAAAVGLGNDDGSALPLPRLVRAAVVEALGHLPRDVVRAHLWVEARGRSSHAVRASGLDVVGTIGDASDVELLLALTGRPASQRRLDRTLERGLAWGLERIAARDTDAMPDALRRALRRADPAHLRPLVDALAAPETRAARREITHALGGGDAADALLFSELVPLVESLGRPDDELLVSRTLEGLRAQDPRVRTQAARVAEVLDLVEAVPILLRASDSEDPLERRTAARALGAILHVNHPAKDGAWRTWAEAEERWWETSGTGYLDALESDERAERTAAIRELFLSRRRRADIVPRLRPFAQGTDVPSRRLALQALGALGGREAEDLLVSALDDPLLAEVLRPVVVRSLESATGLSLGDDARVWRTLLEIRRR